MKRIIMMLAALTTIFALSSILLAQNKTKARAKSTKTKPVSNPNFIGETEKNLSKSKAQSKTEAAVFEPNDANTWIEAHEFDVAIIGKDKPKRKAVTPAKSVKKPVVFNDVIISSKTAKPKAKPTKSSTSKRKQN